MSMMRCCCVVGARRHVIVTMWERTREREGEGHHHCQDGRIDGRCCIVVVAYEGGG